MTNTGKKLNHDTGTRDTLREVFGRMSILPLFGALFFVSLFLNQLPGSFVEIFWAGGLLLVYTVTLVTNRRLYVGAPRHMVLLWIGLLSITLISLYMSQSVGRSVLAWIRLLDAFLVLLLFSTAQETKRVQIYITFKYLGFISLAAFLFLYAYKAATGLPWVNALIAETGHHPASYALVSFLPFFIGATPVIPTLASLFVTAILIGSRSALFLSAFGIVLGAKTLRVARTRRILYGSAVFLIVSILVITALRAQPFALRSALVSRYPMLSVITKEPTSDALRIAYGQQALRAIRQFPLTGYGPGTFEYISRRFETAPASFSAYAHSYFLEFAAENGLPAVFVFLTIVGIIFVDAIRTLIAKDEKRAPFAISFLLMTMYGGIDVPLNYLPYWLLYWAIAGTLLSQYPRHKIPAFPMLTILGLFFLTWTASSVFLSLRMPNTALMLAPYRKDVMRTALTPSTPLSRGIEPAIRRLYAHDPDILFERANVYRNNIDLYVQTLYIDQYNYSYWNRAISAARTTNPRRIPSLLCSLVNIHERGFPCGAFDSDRFAEYSKSDGFSEALSVFSGNDGAAKFFYFIGLTYHEYSEESEFPLLLWNLARNTAPQWGFYHLELASGTFYWHNDRAGAVGILADCMNNPISRSGCAHIRNSPERLMAPGSLKIDIAELPRLLP